MIDFSAFPDLQFVPPFKNDKKFEEFVLEYYNELEETSSYELFGRKGQNQSGLDIYSTEKKTVIQCKCKTIDRDFSKIRKELLSDLKHDLEAFEKFNKRNDNKFDRFIFITTFKNDTVIQESCIKASNQNFEVIYKSWESILLIKPQKTFSKYYGALMTATKGRYGSLEYNSSRDESSLSNNTIDRSLSDKERFELQIKSIYRDLNYVPIHLIINKLPFKDNKDSICYYSSFTLYTNNNALFDYLKNQSKSKKKSESGHQKVIKKLQNNLIFQVSNHTTNESFSLNIPSNKCNCPKCKFSRFDFEESFSSIKDIPNDVDAKFQTAFANYQIGNFLIAKEQFELIENLCIEKELFSKAFIASYNLSKLSILILNQYYGKAEILKITSKLDEIDLLEKSKQFSKNRILQDEIEWIRSDSFELKAHRNINKIVNQIKGHYDIQLNGGSSSNSYASELINSYARLESFLDLNYIIHDSYDEFRELTMSFIEGLFASHAIKSDDHNSRLRHFDDWTLGIIIKYADADKLIRIYKRYNLNQLTYKSTSIHNDSFLDLINKFFTRFQDIELSFKKNCDKENRYFWSRYNRFFSNLMVLSGVLSFDNKELNSISSYLVDFFKIDNPIRDNNIKFFRFFIDRSGNKLSKNSLKELLLVSLINKKLHSSVIDSIINQLEKHHSKISLTDVQLKKAINISLGTCIDCQYEHKSFFITNLFNVVSSKPSKEIIANSIIEVLRKEINFTLYYYSIMYGVLIPNDELFELFHNKVKAIHEKKNKEVEKKNKGILVKKLFRSSGRFNFLNMLLTIIFEHNLNFEKYRWIGEVDLFYSWAMDMKNFNYTNFESIWITEVYGNKIVEEIRKHEIIKSIVKQSIDFEKDERIKKAYLRIF